MTQILEGTWEEIAARAPEWNGKRLRVQVDILDAPSLADDDDAQQEKEETLAEAIARVGTVSGQHGDVASDGKRMWGQHLEAKHRRIQESANTK